MHRPRVYVTRRIPQPGLALLEQHFEVTVRDEVRPITKEELLQQVRGAKGLLCLLTDPVDEDVLVAGDQLVCVSNYAVGYDNIDVAAATRLGIVVTNTPGVLTETTADLAFALLLSAARRIVEADSFMRSGKFKGWDPMLLLGWDVCGATLGIIGFGKIGRAVARRARGFDMRVLYFGRRRLPAAEEERLGAAFAPLERLLRESDFVSLHVPLSRETAHLIGEEQLRLMKPTAVLVNTSRGPVVDERALADALRKGTIAAAGLDVYENEPDVDPILASLPNVVLAPHIGSASLKTRSTMAKLAAQNLIDAILGRRPRFVVNPEVFEKR